MKEESKDEDEKRGEKRVRDNYEKRRGQRSE